MLKDLPSRPILMSTDSVTDLLYAQNSSLHCGTLCIILFLQEWPIGVLGGVCVGGCIRMYLHTYGAARRCRKQAEDGNIMKPLDQNLQNLVDEVMKYL